MRRELPSSSSSRMGCKQMRWRTSVHDFQRRRSQCPSLLNALINPSEHTERTTFVTHTSRQNLRTNERDVKPHGPDGTSPRQCGKRMLRLVEVRTYAKQMISITWSLLHLVGACLKTERRAALCRSNRACMYWLATSSAVSFQFDQ